MRVSVIIPCHNAARWVGEALAGVAVQTRAPHEVIVVDDASTDGSADRVRQALPAARVLAVNHRNAAAARNAGIAAATGDWIALLDADDVWYPNHLERAEELLAGTTDVAYRALGDDLTAEGAFARNTSTQPITETRTGLTHGDYIGFENRELNFTHSSCVVRRDRLLEVGGYAAEQVRRHDIDMWLRLIYGRTWAWDAVPTVAYRVDTPGSICRNYAECEYYYLRALLRNRAEYAGPEMDALLAKAARKVMTLGFVDGTAEQYRRYRELAWPHLPPKVRLAYRCAGVAPALARRLIRAKRAAFARRTGHALPELTRGY